jgi:hypothetical protein
MATQAFDLSDSLSAKIGGASVQAQVASTLAPAYIAKKLLAVPAAECVYVKDKDGRVQVWTVIDAAEESVFDAIYEQEKTLIKELSGLKFDFRVIAREGKPTRSLVSLSCQGWRKAI